MYTKSPGVFVEISYSFGHFGSSDLREKKGLQKTLPRCLPGCNSFRIEVLTRKFPDVLDLHDSAGCMTCLNLVIMSEKTWIVLLGQCCAKTQPCSHRRPILHLEI